MLLGSSSHRCEPSLTLLRLLPPPSPLATRGAAALGRLPLRRAYGEATTHVFGVQVRREQGRATWKQPEWQPPAPELYEKASRNVKVLVEGRCLVSRALTHHGRGVTRALPAIREARLPDGLLPQQRVQPGNLVRRQPYIFAIADLAHLLKHT